MNIVAPTTFRLTGQHSSRIRQIRAMQEDENALGSLIRKYVSPDGQKVVRDLPVMVNKEDKVRTAEI